MNILKTYNCFPQILELESISLNSVEGITNNIENYRIFWKDKMINWKNTLPQLRMLTKNKQLLNSELVTIL